MESESLRNQKAYIIAMSAILSNLINPNTMPISDDLKATIRAMPAWGQYPWRKYDDIPVEMTNKAAFKFLILLPTRFINSLAYLIVKYFQYLPYRATSAISTNQAKLSFFSPCIHLEEFVEPHVLGFWGEVKNLDPRLKAEAVWFLVPYKPPGISHAEVAKQISKIQSKSDFSIFALAALFDLKVLGRACFGMAKFHYYAGFCAFKSVLSSKRIKPMKVIDAKNLGVGIARVEVNRLLVKSALSKLKSVKYIFHLMEGQSWEIALTHHAQSLNKKTIGVIHTPLRRQDSQLLNYLICGEGADSLTGIRKILCSNIYSVKHLEKLGVSSSKLQLVEAQRFPLHTNISQHCYSSGSTKILYVADANSANSEYFQNQILKHLEKAGLESLDIYIQSHPAGSPVLSSAVKLWTPGVCGMWGLVVFGPETSSYLQPEFASSNVRILKPKNSIAHVSIFGAPEIPTIEDFALVSESILNPFVLGEKGSSLIYRNLEFSAWRKVIKDVLKS